MSEVTGLDEVLKKLKKLPEEAKRLVPVRTGTLKKSIGVVKRRSKDKNIIRFSVAPLKKKGGWYAHFVEFGTSKMRAKPFMRSAFEKKGEESIKYVKEYMKKRVEKELAKL